MVATRDLEISSEKTVRAVVSFFLATESGHKELRSFKHHLMQFTGLADIAVNKDLGKSFEMSIARIQKASSRMEMFSLRTQDAWRHEFQS